MKKILTIAIVTILTSSAAFANDDTNKSTTKDSTQETSKVVITKETMKLIKKERKKTSKVFREKNLVC
ncbi:hypothetical protein [Emticicia agri]|uniref:Uncharacterized protein n=1 Tax=Emticicia agri TaxID=2492393 RepID=A0A4Q5LT54_9BACT|nr:hypothetical protein [Emticicia agri]RYU92781.1 hypothetical protein EWM59_25430 [Emticicia agri]